MKKLLFAAVVTLAMVSFTKVNQEKVVLKDVEGTLLTSYVVIDKEAKTVSFSTDANTTVSNAVVDGELRVFLVENDNADVAKSHTIDYNKAKSVSFSHYFENSFDVADANATYMSKAMRPRPRSIIHQ